MLLVWVDAWQMQCCGDPFAVGSSVEWTLAGNIRVPIPETAVVVDVSAADGWFPEPDGLRFNGYLVDLRLIER